MPDQDQQLDSEDEVYTRNLDPEWRTTSLRDHARNPWPAEYVEFVRLFNAREYYGAHEALEDLWAVEVGPLRDFYKGLIQVAGALVLWRKGNMSSSRRLWQSARRYLDEYPESCEGISLSRFILDLETLFGPLLSEKSGGCIPLDDKRTPKIELDDGTATGHP